MNKERPIRFCKSKALCITFMVILITLLILGCGGGGGGSNSSSGGGNDDAPYTLEKAALRTNCFDISSLNTWFSFAKLSENGNPIQDSDVVNFSVTNSSGTLMNFSKEGFYNYSYLKYDCRGGSCTQSGPHGTSGVTAWFDDLPVDTYKVRITMENGQVLDASIDYQRQLTLPMVSYDTMSATFLHNGDLVMDWDNPTSATNWGEVDELRIVIFDNSDGPSANILWISLLPTDPSTITIPALLVADASALASTPIDRWHVQAHAYDSNDMKDAVGFSASQDLP